MYRYDRQGNIKRISSHMEIRWGGHFLADGDRLILGNYKRVVLYDISGGGAPRLLDTRSFKELRDFSFTGEDGFFTTADWSGNRISTKRSFPIAKGQRVRPNGTAKGSNGRFYCLDHGLLIVRNLRTGKTLGKAPARAQYDARLIVRGNRAYAWLDQMGIVVYDVTDPSDIKVLSHTPSPQTKRYNRWRGLCLDGATLYCVNYEGGMCVFDVPKDLVPTPATQPGK